MLALTMAFVGETVPKDKTGSAMGLLGTMSAIGTALGPTLGGLLIAGPGWRFMFLLNLPLGLVTFALAFRHLRLDFKPATMRPASFDWLGTLLLASTLVCYALAMTIGRGSFGFFNASLLLAAIAGIGLFTFVEAKAASPMVNLQLFRDSVLSGGFAMSALVTTVVMATLVVGPFYLSGALALDAALVGLVMSSGPVVAALTGFPSGRLVDRFGAFRASVAGLIAMAIGAAIMPMLPTSFGIAGYIAPLSVITAGYALFQAANITAVVANAPADQRGVVSALLNLSRNLGLVTGASVMGTVFAFGSGASSVVNASAAAVAAGMRLTFATAAVLTLIALAVALITSRPILRAWRLDRSV